jgi:hypothetical protein
MYIHLWVLWTAIRVHMNSSTRVQTLRIGLLGFLPYYSQAGMESLGERPLDFEPRRDTRQQSGLVIWAGDRRNVRLSTCDTAQAMATALHQRIVANFSADIVIDVPKTRVYIHTKPRTLWVFPGETPARNTPSVHRSVCVDSRGGKGLRYQYSRQLG